jgi:hypothetical protein
VWEVVKALREIDERGDASFAAVAEHLALSETRVRVAMHYYSAYPEEILRETTDADDASAAAEVAWQTEQRLLA